MPSIRIHPTDQLCVCAPGLFIFTLYLFTSIYVSFLHLGQYSGKWIRIVSSQICSRVFPPHSGHSSHSFRLKMITPQQAAGYCDSLVLWIKCCYLFALHGQRPADIRRPKGYGFHAVHDVCHMIFQLLYHPFQILFPQQPDHPQMGFS